MAKDKFLNDDELLLGNLSPANIIQIAWEIREHTHDPMDARRLLHKFCDLFDKGELIPDELLRHLRDSFEIFLNSENLPPGQAIAIDTALGLTAGKKGGKFNDKEKHEIAVEFWRLRLNKTTHQEACDLLADKYKCGKTTIGEIWRNKKLDSLIQLRLELRDDGTDLTEEQLAIAKKMTAKERKAIESFFGKDFTPEC